jgi:hypothetical protein
VGPLDRAQRGGRQNAVGCAEQHPQARVHEVHVRQADDDFATEYHSLVEYVVENVEQRAFISA